MACLVCILTTRRYRKGEREERERGEGEGEGVRERRKGCDWTFW